MFRIQHIREEDYWIYPIVLINILSMVAAVFASVITFRAPAIILAFLGTWFTFSKVRRSYSLGRARLHVALTIFSALVIMWLLYLFTN